MKEYLILGFVIILITLVSIIDLTKPKPVSKDISSLQQIQTSKKQEKEENNVTVVVEYIPEKSDGTNGVFTIVLDTHSENLDAFDFQKDVFWGKDGMESLPVAVDQSGSGHHRKAEITFKITSPPFMIVLNNLAEVSKREFQFTSL